MVRSSGTPQRILLLLTVLALMGRLAGAQRPAPAQQQALPLPPVLLHHLPVPEAARRKPRAAKPPAKARPAPISQAPVQGLSQSAWTDIGPAPLSGSPQDISGTQLLSGRVTGIAVDPTDSNTIFLAAAGGGVWMTSDGGTTWTPLTDDQPSLGMGAIAVAPSNGLKIYAGTGEANNCLDCNHGSGILISNDGGSTWSLATGPGDAFSNGRLTVAHISIDPNDPNTAYAAINAGGLNGTSGGGTGIYKTADGGITWANTTASIDTTFSWSAVVVDPNNSSIVYAAHGSISKGASNSTNGVYRTVDGGANWFLLGNAPNAGGSTTTNVGRIELAVDPSANTAGSHVLYVAVENIASGGLFFFERSDNADAATPTFSNLTAGTPDFLGAKNGGSGTGGQGWYDIALNVDASGAVYAAGVECYSAPTCKNGVAGSQNVIRSTTKGASWTDISIVSGVQPHTDSHAIAIDPDGRMLLGSDGGIYRFDPATPGWTVLNGNLETIQFYSVGLDPLSISTAVGGSQDNGTMTYAADTTWTGVFGGDGGTAQISPTNNTRYYATFPFTGTAFPVFGRSDSSGASGTWVNAGTGILATSLTHANFTIPLAVDPTNGDHLLIGLDRVYETTTGGATAGSGSWKAISAPGANGFNSGGAAVNSVAMAPNTQVRYAVTGGSNQTTTHIFVTSNDGTSWSQIDLPAASCADQLAMPVPSAGCGVHQITVDPNDSTGNTALAVINTINNTQSDNNGTFLGSVFRTTNAGTNWANISGDLPSLPVWSIKVDTDPSQTAYISTDAGVYSSPNPYTTWSIYGAGLPNAQGYDLELNSGLRLLAVATHGRGAWEMLTPISVSNVTSTTANGTYGVDTRIEIQVTFTGAVNAAGPLQLGLNTNPPTTAEYSSGSGTNTLTFVYTVAAGETTSGNPTGGFLDYNSNSDLSLNGGRIAGTDGSDVNLTLFPPGAAGSLSANLNIAIDGSTTTPHFVVSRSRAYFGTLPMGTTSAPANTMLGNFTGSPVAVSITPPADWSISANHCPSTLADNATCTFLLVFTPSTVGYETDAVAITAGASNFSFGVDGYGEPSGFTISRSGTALFGPVAVGSNSSPQRTRLGNFTGGPVTLSAVAPPGWKVSSSNCPTVLAVNALCSFFLVFAPTSPGHATGTVNVNTTAGNFSFGVDGIGGAPGFFVSRTGTANFGTISNGFSSAGQRTVLGNFTGTTQAVNITPPQDWSVNHSTCPSSMPANTTCSFQLVFTPTTAGTHSDIVSITAGSSTFTFGVLGIGGP